LSVLKVITRREGDGRVLGVHGAGSVQGPSKPGSPHGSGLGVFRWVVERTLAWLHRFRRLALVDAGIKRQHFRRSCRQKNQPSARMQYARYSSF
jgi:hypothetical protein